MKMYLIWWHLNRLILYAYICFTPTIFSTCKVIRFHGSLKCMKCLDPMVSVATMLIKGRGNLDKESSYKHLLIRFFDILLDRSFQSIPVASWTIDSHGSHGLSPYWPKERWLHLKLLSQTLIDLIKHYQWYRQMRLQFLIFVENREEKKGFKIVFLTCFS